MLLESRLVNWIVTCFKRGQGNILDGASLSASFEEILSRSNGNLGDQIKFLQSSIIINNYCIMIIIYGNYNYIL